MKRGKKAKTKVKTKAKTKTAGLVYGPLSEKGFKVRKLKKKLKS